MMQAGTERGVIRKYHKTRGDCNPCIRPISQQAGRLKQTTATERRLFHHSREFPGIVSRWIERWVDVDSNADSVADCKQHPKTLAEFRYVQLRYLSAL
jgi:hypothetical protein